MRADDKWFKQLLVLWDRLTFTEIFCFYKIDFRWFITAVLQNDLIIKTTIVISSWVKENIEPAATASLLLEYYLAYSDVFIVGRKKANSICKDQ